MLPLSCRYKFCKVTTRINTRQTLDHVGAATSGSGGRGSCCALARYSTSHCPWFCAQQVCLLPCRHVYWHNRRCKLLWLQCPLSQILRVLAKLPPTHSWFAGVRPTVCAKAI